MQNVIYFCHKFLYRVSQKSSSKFFHYRKDHAIYTTSRRTLSMLLHYLGKLKSFYLLNIARDTTWKAISYVTKMKHFLSYDLMDINTVIILLKCLHLHTHMH